jgi:hypothetical protein
VTNSLSKSINAKLQTISQRINHLVGAFKDHHELADADREVPAQAAGGLGKRKKQPPADDFSLMALNFGTPGNEDRPARSGDPQHVCRPREPHQQNQLLYQRDAQ